MLTAGNVVEQSIVTVFVDEGDYVFVVVVPRTVRLVDIRLANTTVESRVQTPTDRADDLPSSVH